MGHYKYMNIEDVIEIEEVWRVPASSLTRLDRSLVLVVLHILVKWNPRSFDTQRQYM
jgi:hypothetical protein